MSKKESKAEKQVADVSEAHTEAPKKEIKKDDTATVVAPFFDLQAKKDRKVGDKISANAKRIAELRGLGLVQ